MRKINRFLNRLSFWLTPQFVALSLSSAAVILGGWWSYQEAWGSSDLEQHRKQWETMSVEEKTVLMENLHWFRRLDLSEQEKLRGFSREISSDPKAEELRETLVNYQQWLASMNSWDKNRLATTGEDDRLRMVRNLREGESLRLSADDLEVLTQWLRNQFVQHQLPEEKRQALAQLNDRERSRRTWLEFFEWLRSEERMRKFHPSPADVDQLLFQFSESARNMLVAADTVEEKGKLFKTWREQLRRLPLKRGSKTRGLEELMTSWNDLSEEQRMHLRALSAEELKGGLRFLPPRKREESAREPPLEPNEKSPQRKPGKKFPQKKSVEPPQT